VRIVGGNWHVSEPKAHQEADIHGGGSPDPAVVVNAITHHASSGRSNNCRDKAIIGTPASEEIFDAGIHVPEFALPRNQLEFSLIPANANTLILR
jgi:hypothetical protein